MFSMNLSKKLYIRVNNINNISKVVIFKTRLKILLKCKGVSVKIFDKFNNLVLGFPTKLKKYNLYKNTG